MTLEDFKDWLFNLLNEVDADTLTDIEIKDKLSTYYISIEKDGFCVIRTVKPGEYRFNSLISVRDGFRCIAAKAVCQERCQTLIPAKFCGIVLTQHSVKHAVRGNAPYP